MNNLGVVKMKICCLSDLHGFKPEVEECDLILIAGDLTNKGEYFELRDFWGYVWDYLAYKARDIVIIAGNHDFGLEKGFEQPRSFVKSNDNATLNYLYNSSCVVQGLKIWGTPHTLRFYDWAFNSSEEELFDIFDKCPFDTDIILSHGPPRDILDASKRDSRLGSVSLKLKCSEIKPKLCVFGHIHESVGQVLIDKTLYVNASCVNDKYKPNGVSPFYVTL